MRVRDRLSDATQRLQAQQIESAALDARLMLQHIMRWEHADVIRHADEMLSDTDSAAFETAIDRRLQHEPLSHIVGYRDFWRDRFNVSSDVLDPRPDSETLIEAVLALRPDRAPAYRIVDFGTGSGCLLLSLLREYPNATGIGVDASQAALIVAEKNAKSLKLQERAAFLHSNWGETLTDRYDMVITNPPYISEQEIAGLAPEVREYEPYAALCGGADGLASYQSVMPHVRRCLRDEGIAVVELGAGQAESVEAIARANGMRCISLQKDLGGIERALCLTPA